MSQHVETALLADIGATNARFALLAGDGPSAVTIYPVAGYPTPVDAAREFLAGPGGGAQPQTAVIAAAGPVKDGRVTMVNAAWEVDEQQIRQGLGLRTAHVINDFAAQAWALPGLHGADLVTIGEVSPLTSGTMVVMGPGSGFGLAAMTTSGGKETVLVTEAGHATLPAENRRDDAIIQSMRDKLGHISIERALSGPGLIHLYDAVVEIDRLSVPQRTAAEIVEHGLAADCAACRATLDAFCAFLGSVAGNAALTFGALGGVFIGGGIVPRFTEFLSRSAFRERFKAKGRLSAYLAPIPTSVVVHPNPAFVGLAQLARRLATSPDLL
jgi:glucokinase